MKNRTNECHLKRSPSSPCFVSSRSSGRGREWENPAALGSAPGQPLPAIQGSEVTGLPTCAATPLPVCLIPKSHCVWRGTSRVEKNQAEGSLEEGGLFLKGSTDHWIQGFVRDEGHGYQSVLPIIYLLRHLQSSSIHLPIHATNTMQAYSRNYGSGAIHWRSGEAQ